MTARNLFLLKPSPPEFVPEGRVRLFLVNVVSHPEFENVIAALITSNIVVLAVYYFGQPGYWTTFIQVLTWCFNILFACEAAAKLIGYGPKLYFGDAWNQFDFFLVMASLMDVLMDLGIVPDGGAIISVIRVFRIFRVMRMFRLAK